jgi:hypothetical protein
MTDTAIIDAVRIAGEQGENTPWATPEGTAHMLGQESSEILTKLDILATAGILAKDYAWRNIAPEGIVGVSPEVGYDTSRPRFRVL